MARTGMAMREVQSREQSRESTTAGGKSREPSTGDPRAAAENFRQQPERIGTNRLAPVPNHASAAREIRPSAPAPRLHPKSASPSRAAAAKHSAIGGTFSGKRLQPEVLTSTSAATPTATLQALDKLNQAATHAAASPAPGRRVHIAKLHITVQRPSGEALPQPATVAEVRRAPQPAGPAFSDPWERHYLSFD
jgi:hypothetical protein